MTLALSVVFIQKKGDEIKVNCGMSS